MESTRFDRIARQFGERRTRRGALGALLGGLAGGAVVASGVGAAPKVKPDCCPPDHPTLCVVTCTNMQTDPANCGRCGNLCDSGTCTNGTCRPATPTPTPTATNTPAPTCSDGIQNGSEADVDCGGGICPPCVNGKTCLANNDCQSGNCVVGVCQDCPIGQTACKGICVSTQTDLNNCGTCGQNCAFPNATANCIDGACKLVACKQGFANCNGNPADGCEADLSGTLNCGSCGNVCLATPASTCGTTGQCSAGQCLKHPAGTACGLGSCTGSVFTPQVCDGNGTCAAGPSTNCTPFACGNGACKTTCTIDADCAAGFYCAANGICAAKKASGAPCGANDQCILGLCTNGFCQ